MALMTVMNQRQSSKSISKNPQYKRLNLIWTRVNIQIVEPSSVQRENTDRWPWISTTIRYGALASDLYLTTIEYGALASDLYLTTIRYRALASDLYTDRVRSVSL